MNEALAYAVYVATAVGIVGKNIGGLRSEIRDARLEDSASRIIPSPQRTNADPAYA